MFSCQTGILKSLCSQLCNERQALAGRLVIFRSHLCSVLLKERHEVHQMELVLHFDIQRFLRSPKKY